MGKSLRLLIVEDVETDALLVVRELQRGGFDVTYERVETPEAMTSALSTRPWDLVISDWTMPHFSAQMALRLVRERGLDLPFIIVSGTVSDDVAVDALRSGAQDFMAKGRCGRLIPAIERELRDVSLRAEQEKLQHQLTISDRMASMGTLAAGVAHEINNPLACVMANIELAIKGLDERAEVFGHPGEFSEVREELDDARAAVERIRDIVRDLKVFSRSREEVTGPVDVAHVMESTLRMATIELRHRARVVKSYGQTPPVQASESRLGQVFLNLVVNASQAIPEGHAADNEIRITTSVEPGGNVVVEISDTGSGMSPDVMGHLFTPFFTTKPVGVGTGLGLSICHRIVTDFGGTISVMSAPGEGTTFTISLPPSRGGASSDASQSAHAVPIHRHGRVLVVDDEPMIRRVIQRALQADHEVVTTGRAGEALKMTEAGVRFDVILCDLMMPEMTGMELYAAVLALDPAYAERMVFMTGGAFTPAAQSFLHEVSNDRVEKPFDAQDLRALVNDRIK